MRSIKLFAIIKVRILWALFKLLISIFDVKRFHICVFFIPFPSSEYKLAQTTPVLPPVLTMVRSRCGTAVALKARVWPIGQDRPTTSRVCYPQICKVMLAFMSYRCTLQMSILVIDMYTFYYRKSLTFSTFKVFFPVEFIHTIMKMILKMNMYDYSSFTGICMSLLIIDICMHIVARAPDIFLTNRWLY